MIAIQGTSLYSFIYMCIVQASSISTATFTDYHVFMVSFLSEMNYLAALGLFFWWISDDGVCVHVSAIQYVKHLIFSMQYAVHGT